MTKFQPMECEQKTSALIPGLARKSSFVILMCPLAPGAQSAEGSPGASVSHPWGASRVPGSPGPAPHPDWAGSRERKKPLLDEATEIWGLPV